MPMMKSPYDQVIASLSGHRLIFKAGEPVWVPPSCVEQALGQGIQDVDQEAPYEPKVVAPAKNSDNDEDGEERFETALDNALLRILTRKDLSDYKSDNTPKVTKVVAEMSPELRRPTATEVSDAFMRLQENIDLAE